MKKRSIITFTLLSFCIAATSTVCAEKYDWSDPTYDFTKIKKVMVMELDTSNTSINSGIVERVLKSDFRSKSVKLPVTLVSPALAPPLPATQAPAPKVAKAVDKSVPLENVANAPLSAILATNETAESETKAAVPAAKAPADKPLTPEELAYLAGIAKVADVFVEADLMTYQTDQYFVPAHTEWHTDYRDVTWYDHHGHPHYATQSYDYPVYVPDHYVPAASVAMRFNVYDAQSGRAVFSREESRVRSSSNDMRGVYNRIIDSFYKTMKSKIKP